MRRGPRPGSAAPSHKPNPAFFSDHSNSSESGTSVDSGSQRSRPGAAAWKLNSDSLSGAGQPRPTDEACSSLGHCPDPRGFLSNPEQAAPGAPGGPSAPLPPKNLKSHLRRAASGFPRALGGALVRLSRAVQSLRCGLTVFTLLGIVLAANYCGVLDWLPKPGQESDDFLSLSEYHRNVRSHGQQLKLLRAELARLHGEVTTLRAANTQQVAKLVFQQLNEDVVRKPDFALSSVGASIDLDRTSQDYEDGLATYFWNRLSFWNYAKSPSVILEPDVFPGNCWAFRGARGHVVIRLPGRVQLSDITLQHPPPSVAHRGSTASAPRDFVVYGLLPGDHKEVFLGRFTFDVEKSELQTFHLQNQPPAAFPKVKVQILSNWGHPRFTCLYRVRAHGTRVAEGEGDAAAAGPEGPAVGEQEAAGQGVDPHAHPSILGTEALPPRSRAPLPIPTPVPSLAPRRTPLAP
ncbi:sperm-associated antigen 4 protein [Tachyglossus aculeatus]|uniref:sperm-associated antigen 4 protein n=1 Tax=Tachyglossus aculeatus TaxID=9261 RepID=UPI0018F77554|nr:sperm-associated antigen 4 protein [Tachyglossus aculeatus]